jgi:hypothetical protein
MKRVLAFVLASATLALLAAVFPTQAMAASSVSVSMTFAEPIIPAVHKGCPVLPNGFCGTGQVIPLGQATETIEFRGCGEFCDLRTINLATGSIFLHEVPSNVACPGACQQNPAVPISATLDDVIVGGTGTFTGASGTLSGSVHAAGPESVVKLSGTLALAT